MLIAFRLISGHKMYSILFETQDGKLRREAQSLLQKHDRPVGEALLTCVHLEREYGESILESMLLERRRAEKMTQ